MKNNEKTTPTELFLITFCSIKKYEKEIQNKGKTNYIDLINGFFINSKISKEIKNPEFREVYFTYKKFCEENNLKYSLYDFNQELKNNNIIKKKINGHIILQNMIFFVRSDIKLMKKSINIIQEDLNIKDCKKCSKCNLGEICKYKKEYINLIEKIKNIDIPNEVSNIFSIKLKCNYFIK